MAKPKYQVCSSCGIDKPLDSYRLMPKGLYKKQCLECAKERRHKREGETAEGYLKRLLKNAKARRLLKSAKARKQNLEEPSTIELEHLIELWVQANGRCALSGIHMTHHVDGKGSKDLNVSLDRIDADKGYIPGNVQLVCLRVNLMRHTLTSSEFYWWVKTIANHSCD